MLPAMARPKIHAARAGHPWAMAALLLGACAGAQQQPTTPQSTEVVIDDPLVVEAAAKGDDLGFTVLPRLPRPLEAMGAPLQPAYATALAVLRDPAMAPRTQGQSYDAWLRQTFEPWLATTRERIDGAVTALAGCSEAAEDQRVVASALTGLLWMRLVDQFNAVPPPDGIADDLDLLRIYRHGLDRSTGPWLDLATGPLQYCTQHASWLATGSGWLRLCQRQLNALTAMRQEAIARGRAVAEQQEAERQARIGPRPAGPEICWTPRLASQASAPPRTDERPVTHTAVLTVGDTGNEPRGSLEALVAGRVIELSAAAGHPIERLAEGQRKAALRAQRQGRGSLGGPRCGRAAEPADVLRASYPGLALAVAERRCESGRCSLQVTLDAGVLSKGEPAWLRASGGGDPADLAGSVARLAPGLPMAPIEEPADPAAAPPPDRDLAYGRLDPATGVRVSADVPEHVTMDASPLADAAVTDALAACFAASEKPDKQPTVAVHAHLDVTKAGRVRGVRLTPEPSDAATPPAAALEHCVSQALQRVSFGCPASGRGAQAKVTYCMRRDAQPPLRPSSKP